MSTMHFRVRGSGWLGLALLSSAAAAGCAVMPAQEDAGDQQLLFLTMAMETPSTALDRMLVAAKHESGPAGQLHVAILESLPGHDGYDPDRAKAMLTDLGNHYGDSAIGSVAHERLAEMWRESACIKQSDALKLKLHQMVDIERSIDKPSR